MLRPGICNGHVCLLTIFVHIQSTLRAWPTQRKRTRSSTTSWIHGGRTQSRPTLSSSSLTQSSLSRQHRRQRRRPHHRPYQQHTRLPRSTLLRHHQPLTRAAALMRRRKPSSAAATGDRPLGLAQLHYTPPTRCSRHHSSSALSLSSRRSAASTSSGLCSSRRSGWPGDARRTACSSASPAIVEVSTWKATYPRRVMTRAIAERLTLRECTHSWLQRPSRLKRASRLKKASEPTHTTIHHSMHMSDTSSLCSNRSKYRLYL